MPPPTALIAEDELLLAQALQAELSQAWPELQLLGRAADGEEAVEMALALRPQVVFLDIRMPGCSGLEAAQAIVEDWPQGTALPLIVFVTAYDQYAVQAFERCAADYLLKPVQSARLAACCQRLQGLLRATAHTHAPAAPARAEPASDPDAALLDQLRALLQGSRSAGGVAGLASPDEDRSPLTVIQAGVGSVTHLVPVNEVIYFEAADKYLRVVTAEREHLIRYTLRELLPRLDAQRFWQVHRSTVVQIQAVSQAHRDEAGRVTLQLRQRPERLAVSRVFAPRFKGL